MKIIKIIYDSIDEINDEMDSIDIEKSRDTQIFGPDSKLDSMGLVQFISIIEDKLETVYDEYIPIADERAMSMENSPFKTVGTLEEYIQGLVDNL